MARVYCATVAFAGRARLGMNPFEKARGPSPSDARRADEDWLAAVVVSVYPAGVSIMVLKTREAYDTPSSKAAISEMGSPGPLPAASLSGSPPGHDAREAADSDVEDAREQQDLITRGAYPSISL